MVTRHIWNDINHHAASKAHDSWIFIIFHVCPYVYVYDLWVCYCCFGWWYQKCKMTYNLTLCNVDEINRNHYNKRWKDWKSTIEVHQCYNNLHSPIWYTKYQHLNYFLFDTDKFNNNKTIRKVRCKEYNVKYKKEKINWLP